MRYLQSALLCLALFFTPAWALDPAHSVTQYAHGSWGPRDGLPSTVVMAINQTPDGYLWVGTTTGLAKFDGHTFTRVATHPTEPNRVEAIAALQVQKDGSMLWGMRNGGLRRYAGGEISRIGTDVIDPIIRTVKVGSDGVVRVGTVLGLFEIRQDGQIAKIPTRHAYVSDLSLAPDGSVYVATQRGLHIFRRDGESLVDVPVDQNVVERVLVDRDGNVWIGTYHGLFLYRNNEFVLIGKEQGLLGDHVTALYQDRDGNIWVGTTEGLNRMRVGDKVEVRPTDRMKLHTVMCLAEDQEGSLWIGSRDGLHRLKDVSIVPWTTDEGLLGNVTPAVNGKADGSLLIFYSGDPTGVSELKNGVLKSRTDIYDGPSYVAPDGTLWVANTGVLFKVSGDQVQRFGPEHGLRQEWISSIGADDQSLILSFAMMGGIKRFTGQGLEPYLLRDGTPFAVPFHVMYQYRQADGTLWMATYDGVWKLRDGEVTRYTSVDGERSMQYWYKDNPQGKHFRTVVDPGLPDNWFTYISEGPDGALWFASHRTGLARLKDGRFNAITAAQGLVSNENFSVLVDRHGDVWGSCASGIFRIKRSDLENFFAGKSDRVTPRLFTDEDGMKTEEAMHEYQPVAWESPDGVLWFATKQGVVSVDPDKLRHNLTPPPVLVERLLIDGVSFPAKARHEIEPGHNKLDIEFTALSMLAPSRVRFRYILEGYDQKWMEVSGERAARYTKVPAGKYRFRVLACNNDGVWNETGATVDLVVHPRFYQTWWFALICTGAVVGLIFSGHVWRVRRLRMREAILQERVAQRTAELSQANEKLTSEIAERRKAEEEVERIHRKLLTASHQAGMAEVATGVLHNVGNVLNSVNVSTATVTERLANSKVSSVEKLAAMLAEHEADLARFLTEDPRGSRIPKFIRDLAPVLKNEQAQALAEIRRLQSNIDHIKEIVTMQQNYARVSGVAEPMSPEDLFNEAMLINAGALARHEIEVVREIDPAAGTLVAEKHKVLQILVNLITNAKYACQQSGNAQKRIVLSARRKGEQMLIAVADNGVGIAPENLVRIFNHGFTTRKDGHGFGLHSGALAATEMGGTLTVHSAGLGQGATFTLTIPVKPVPRSQG
jgi:ligand-binding sensor domain-containing protein/signal transduction histidine kinase